MAREHLGLLLAGLAAGDSLGSTSEYMSHDEIIGLYGQYGPNGWPFRHVGGGHFLWMPGEATDDSQMAACMVRSYLKKGKFVPEHVAEEFVQWAMSCPRSIGATTVRGLGSIALGTPWYEGGLEDFTSRPANTTNGSLMRNGVIPGFAESIEDAFRMSLCHGVMTHYAPLCVLCCAIQTWLIWEFLEGRNPFGENWLQRFWRLWIEWYKNTRDDAIIDSWSTSIAEQYPKAYKALLDADFNHESFSPFKHKAGGDAGSVLTTLQTALWGVQWSLSGEKYTAPDGFPAQVFERRGPWVLGWIAMTGGDTGTYCSTAGPIIAAAHGSLPPELVQGLEILKEFKDLIPGI
jgi:ADP-ribosylglycohydrolase